MERRVGLAMWKVVAMMGVVGLAPILAMGQTSGTPTPVAPVANACPRFDAGSEVRNPGALFSARGALWVEFSYQTRMDDHGRQLFCFMTPAGLENPTLHVSPGDHLIITVTNNTTGGMDPMSLNPPNCGSNVMNTASVNIHYHGTNTAPVCGQDEVIKTIINPGQTFQYNVDFPKDEPPGLYWYHPHVHGIADPAVMGGASGAIVVDGINNVQPEVAGLPQRIFVIRDQRQIQNLDESEGGCKNGVPFRDITVNNVPIDSEQAIRGGPVTFTPAVLNVRPNEKEFWRVSNSSADTILDLQVQEHGVAQMLQLVAIDGVSVNSQDGMQPGRLIPAKHFRLPPASRVEFLVRTPPGNGRPAELVTTSINTGASGDCDPERPIFTIVPAEEAARAETKNADGKMGAFTGLNTAGQRFAKLGAAAVAQTRLVYFDEKDNPDQFFMAVEGQPEAIFDPNAPPAITATQGTVERWTVENRTTENHEFHMHQIHFLVESQNNFRVNGQQEAPAVSGQYLDMIEVPGWDGKTGHPFPSVTLRMDFRGPDVGIFVFHCHILEHEDGGMMNIIQVVPAASAENGNQKRPAAGTGRRDAVEEVKPSAGAKSAAKSGE